MATYYLQDIAKIVGVTRQTIYNWLQAGVVGQPGKDYRGYRIFNDQDLKDLLDYKNRERVPGETGG